VRRGEREGEGEEKGKGEREEGKEEGRNCSFSGENAVSEITREDLDFDTSGWKTAKTTIKNQKRNQFSQPWERRETDF
jgi:hypothetical protein